MNRPLRILLFLLAVFVGGSVIAGVSYWAGASSVGAPATAAAAGPYWGGWHAWGWGGFFFWPLFPILFIVLLFVLFRAMFGGRRGPGWGPGPRGWDDSGYGPYGPNHWTSHRDAAFEEWHRRAHGEAPGAAGPSQPGMTPPGGDPNAPGAPR